MLFSKKLEKLFEEVISLPEKERANFISESCGTDAKLKTQLSNLILAAEKSEDYFGKLSTLFGLKNILDGRFDFANNKVVGNYRLLELIGRGGMGAVYLAERCDQQFEKKVALKVLPINASGEKSLHYFFSERSILASLQHPHIAGLLDGGIADHDTPYFVMDYIEGVNVEEYCRREQLTISQKLELFLQVASAVDYAHKKLIVHRDIKPNNVLVDQQGQVKLVDFGIAKILDEKSQSDLLTSTAFRPMTILYASPEHIRGDGGAITMDIYSLGMLLFKLLTGTYPYRVNQLDILEVHKSILQSQPLLASKAVLEFCEENDCTGSQPSAEAIKNKNLANRLSGDLDAIISKSISKNPNDRYASVEQLIADINCFSNQQPVAARIPSKYYLTKMFIKRNLLLVSSLTIILTMTIGLIISSLNYSIETRNQSAQIAKERDAAILIKNFMLGIFENTHPDSLNGKQLNALELLDFGAMKLEQELNQTPLIKAELLQTIGGLYASRTEWKKAEDQYQAALTLIEQKYQKTDPIYIDVLFRLAHALEQNGNYQKSKALSLEVLRLSEKVQYKQGIIESLVLSARVLQRLGEQESIEVKLLRALNLQKSVMPKNKADISNTLQNLAAIKYQNNEFSDAKKLYQEALELLGTAKGKEPLASIGLLYALGNVARREKEYEVAISYQERALELSKKLVPQGSADTVYMLNGLGKVYQELGRYHEAAKNFEQSAQVAKNFFGERHPNRAFALHNLGAVLLELNQVGKAKFILKEALSIVDEKLPDHPIREAIKVTQSRADKH